MLQRKIINELEKWSKEPKKRALCIIGARQIGKTTAVRTFAQEHYTCFVEINFIEDKNAEKIFAGALDANTIITNLTAYSNKTLIPGETLILLDEVQECPNVRTAIKFLVEDGRFDYVETGSLLGVKYKDVKSYPVGYEEIHRMYPLDFEEFLWANGVQQDTINYVQNCCEKLQSLTELIHNTMLRLFQTYIVVGGMPAVVQDYVDNHDIGRVINLQQNILAAYRLDIAKYTIGGDRLKVKNIFDSLGAQLDSKNRRFMLSKIAEKGRLSVYENSFAWLTEAGVALPCYNVAAPVAPLTLNVKHSLFKLYMGDTGLLCASSLDNVQFAVLNGDLAINMGSILENVMAQQLQSQGIKLYYFANKKYGEIDFIMQQGSKIVPLEIKSGNDYTKHKALDHIMAVEAWEIKKALVFCKSNIEQREGITYLPWYGVMFLKGNFFPEQLHYEVDISKL